ncbi:MAG: sulfate reduction electron transfer complex DsrMKJOP subunit DsrO [Roseiarcus sp.]
MTRSIDDGRPENGARRGFLAAAASLALATLAPGVTLYAFGAAPSGGKASPSRRWGLIIDVGKCADGCDKCVTACRTENGWGADPGPADIQPQWIRKVELKDAKSGATRALPVMCQHCASPPCVDVCPTGASFKRPDGIVLVDKHICIGCRYCMMACPYKARSFVHEPIEDQKPWAPRGRGTVESCTLCVHRIDAGRLPACVETCNAEAGGAMMFGDLADPDSDISRAVASRASAQIRADLGLDPGVRYENL